MADTNLQSLSSATPVATDEIEFLDKSDTGMSPGGSNKRSTIENVLTLYSGPFVGTFKVRQTGGVADIDEIHISHDGAHGTIESKSGNLNFVLPYGGTWIFSGGGDNDIVLSIMGTGRGIRTVNFSQAMYSTGWRFRRGIADLAWTNAEVYNVPDVGINTPSAGVLSVTDGSTGGGILEFPQVSAGGTPSTNSGRIYAKDVAGNAELFVKDEAGTETQISPHSIDGPATLYDSNDSLPHVVKEVNDYLGGVRYLNLSRACMLLEDLLKAIAVGNTLTQIRTFLTNRGAGFIDIYRVESFSQHNTRLGLTGEKALTIRDWSDDQDAKQLEYDNARETEVTKYNEWVENGEVGQEPSVRPVADIRKPVPTWLSSRGVSG